MLIQGGQTSCDAPHKMKRTLASRCIVSLARICSVERGCCPATIIPFKALLSRPWPAPICPTTIRGFPAAPTAVCSVPKFRTAIQHQICFPRSTGQLISVPARTFSSSSSAEPAREDATFEGKLLKFLIVATFVAVALKLAPSIGAGNVTQSVRLLEADMPLLQRSGAHRVRLIAASGLADQQLMDVGAPGRLLALLHPDSDQGVMNAVVEALDEISKKYDGREALVLAGAVDVLEKAVEERWMDDLVAQDNAAALLVALKVQQDHVE